MNGTEIRLLRRRLGLTQNDVAVALQVDQGTVSRWERGKEQPRPASLAALRDLVQSDTEKRAASRLRGVMAGNMYSMVFINTHGRITDVSRLCEEHYLHRFGFDIRAHLGQTFRSHMDFLGRHELSRLVSDCRVLTGDILLMRIWSNVRGIASCNVFEPIFEHGSFVGTAGYLATRHRIEPNDEISVEKVEAIYAEAPERLELIEEGSRASMMQPGFIPPPPTAKGFNLVQVGAAGTQLPKKKIRNA